MDEQKPEQNTEEESFDDIFVLPDGQIISWKKGCGRTLPYMIKGWESYYAVKRMLSQGMITLDDLEASDMMLVWLFAKRELRKLEKNWEESKGGKQDAEE